MSICPLNSVWINTDDLSDTEMGKLLNNMTPATTKSDDRNSRTVEYLLPSSPNDERLATEHIGFRCRRRRIQS
jgi:hypothetical protein